MRCRVNQINVPLKLQGALLIKRLSALGFLSKLSQQRDKFLQHALLIINPHSRNGQAEALEGAVRLLEDTGIEVSVCESASESHLVSLIEDYDHEDGIVILAGGDGTISAALETLYNCQRTLAIFPMGTANDLARSIGISEDLLAAAQAIVTGKRERISLGQVNKHYFINVAHVGLGVDVTVSSPLRAKSFLGYSLIWVHF